MDEQGTQPDQPDQPDQPAYGAAFAPLPAVEVLASDDEGQGLLGAGAAPGHKRRWVAGVAAAAVLVASGGAYVAYGALSGGGARPTDVLPAKTLGVLQVDLDPSAGQKLELYRLLRKFPHTAGLQDTDKDFGGWLVRRLSESGSGEGLDFATDVQPWLGKRFAIAVVPGGGGASASGSGGSGSPVQPLVVLQETDEKAAAAALDKLKETSPDLGYAFMNGFVVVSPESKTVAAESVAAAAKASLTADPHFSADVDAIGSDQVVTGWVDAGRASDLLKQTLDNQGGGLGLPGLVGNAWKGRWVLGLHAADGAVELRMRSFDGSKQPAAPTVTGLDKVLPDAFAVMAVGGAGQRIASAWKQAESSPQYADLMDQAHTLGLDLPGDLATLLGDDLVVSVGGDPTGQPTFLAASTSKNPEKARSVLTKLLTSGGTDRGFDPAIEVRGSTLYVGSSQAAVDSAGHGKLQSSELFRRAVANPSGAQVLVFVDLTKVWATMEQSGSTPADKEATQVAAVGFSASDDNGSTDLTVRVVFR